MGSLAGCCGSLLGEGRMKPWSTVDTHTNRMECPTAKTLLEEYARAATEYFEAVDRLSSLVGSHDQFADAKRQTENTNAKCIAARLALEKHRIEHNCRVVAAGSN
jgi:hypothetical protein